MCLDYLKDREDILSTKRTKDKLYTGYKVVKKLVLSNGEKLYKSDCRNFSFHKGINEADSTFFLDCEISHKKYLSGFHIWAFKKGALKWVSNREAIIPVKFHKSWVVAAGVQFSNDVLVLNKMTIEEIK